MHKPNMQTRPFVVADIGGTHCRFAVFNSAPVLQLVRSTWHKTAGLHTLDDVLAAYAASNADLPVHEAAAFACAIAGPVRDTRYGQLTNARLTLDIECTQTLCEHPNAWIINDFQAQAYACITTPGRTARAILGPHETEHADSLARGIVGAGTGLGTGLLLPATHGQWCALPSEGGHAAFPFVGKDESAFERFVCAAQTIPYARGDDIVTGRGLTLLHQFLEGEQLAPQAIAAKSFQADTPTRRWFARFLARTCRNWALITLCKGGLFIAGGIAAKNPNLVTCASFADEFYESPNHESVLRAIPLALMADENSGLWGAAEFARQRLEAGHI